MSREQMQGITLSDPRWVLSGKPPDPSRFFGALLDLFPVGVLLFMEGGSHPPEMRRLIDLIKVEASPRPALGTLWPRHDSVTLRVLPAIMEELVRLTARLPVPGICDHLHVFDGGRVLMEGYDAFRAPFRVSGFPDEQRLKRFCEKVGCGYHEVSRP